MTYTRRRIMGWAALILLSFSPVALLFVFGNAEAELTDYASITHELGEIFGLVGMTMFALTFVLSTRIKSIEDVFGGLDKVYIVHGILGGTALILLLAHPIFLVLKFIPHDFITAAGYLLPSSYWSTNFGILALLGMTVLIAITLFSKMKYHRWKFLHEFLGLVFVFAVLHTFLVRGEASQDDIFTGYYIYATVVSLVGLSAFSYSLFIKDRLIKNAIYKIDDICIKKDVLEITITPEHKPLGYHSGQFVFLRFYNKNLSKEAHPFSIASQSHAYKMKVIVKNLGDYTNRMKLLKVGDKVSVEGPYGRFHFRNYHNENQVWIAAGIGITPFIGMAEDLEKDDVKRNVVLYHTVKSEEDLIGYGLFMGISSRIRNFRIRPWISDKMGRITAQNIVRDLGSIKDKQFLICGSSQFKEMIIEGLLTAGVKKDSIHEEAFDFR